MPFIRPGDKTTRRSAFIDISIVGVVFWSVWSLRFAGVQNVGLWTVLASIGAGAGLMALRNESWRDFGLRTGGDTRFVVSRAAEFAGLAFFTGIAVIGIATAIGYPPSKSAVLVQQPDTLSGFLLDLLFGVWIGAAIGEELLFRGFLLTKFTSLFGDGRLALSLAILAQAIWFGAGHISQGISGMIMAGTIGAVVGVFFVTRARRALLPLIIGHGFVDTVSQTIYFLK
ncbi:MAG: CPBP family intramembrane metalloprotease [Gammaproteobacteria bacterium]|nr:CPBP family intramembrane metalloprotease [Gammaproteobacteria bacterium]